MRSVIAIPCVALLLVSLPVLGRPDALQAKLEELGGATAVDCNTTSSTGAAPSVLSCAAQAAETAQPFFVTAEVSCVDCSFWLAAAGSDEGLLWEVTYDTNPSGSSADTPELKSRRCSKLVIDSTAFPPILCVPADGH
jgi:hypothetical protein